jgi:hypothetical protein
VFFTAVFEVLPGATLIDGSGSVAAGPSTRRSLLSSTPSVIVSYTVASSTASYTSVTGALTASISSGTFTTYLQAAAVQYTYTPLASASSSIVPTYANVQPTAAPTSSPKKAGLSGGAIAAIVIGSIAGAALVGGGTYMAVNKPGSNSPEDLGYRSDQSEQQSLTNKRYSGYEIPAYGNSRQI